MSWVDRFTDEQAEPPDGSLALFPHPGGGFVFGVVDGHDYDAARTIVAWDDFRLSVESGDVMFDEAGGCGPRAGLLVGRRYETAAAAVADWYAYGG